MEHNPIYTISHCENIWPTDISIFIYIAIYWLKLSVKDMLFLIMSVYAVPTAAVLILNGKKTSVLRWSDDNCKMHFISSLELHIPWVCRMVNPLGPSQSYAEIWTYRGAPQMFGSHCSLNFCTAGCSVDLYLDYFTFTENIAMLAIFTEN